MYMFKKTIFLISVSILVSAVTSYIMISNFKSQWERKYKVSTPIRYVNYESEGNGSVSNSQYTSSFPNNFTKAAFVATPTVVNIQAKTKNALDIWSMDSGTSTGSGVIVSADGYIITNRHVIQGANDLNVTLSNNREYKAELIGQDNSTDLALLKINARNLKPIKFGNSDSLMVGEWVLAVGNPFNLSSTVTAGIVSAKGRSIDILDDAYRIESFIQTDAAVNPGNSGGALINTNGDLVGINTAIVTKSGRYEGYSFATPVNVVRKVINDIMEFGQVQRGILGIGPEEISSDLARSLQLPNVSGVYVGRVNPDGAADRAGLKPADVIVSINGKTANSVPVMQEILATYRPGSKLSVVFYRYGKKMNTEVTLQNKLSTTTMIDSNPVNLLDDFGFELRDLTNKERNQFEYGGALVQSVRKKSKVDKTNLEAGFIITRVNNIKVSTVNQVINEINKQKGKIKLEGLYPEYPGRYSYEFER